jgi:septin family protein
MLSLNVWHLNIVFRLKPLDVAFMKAIHNKVNIVPVIAKADTLTLKERERLKKRVSRKEMATCAFSAGF